MESLARIMTADDIIARLEEAGRTLLALHVDRVWPSEGRVQWPEMVRDSFIDMPSDRGPRWPVPDAAAISRMDEAYAWVSALIGARVQRRIVRARSLVHPLNERHLYSWRRIGQMVRAHPEAVRTWHAKGVAAIVLGLGGEVGPPIVHPRTRRKQRARIVAAEFGGPPVG